jgi:hypothetical protein
MYRWLQFRLRTIFLATAICGAALAFLLRAQRLHETARRLDIERSMAESRAELAEQRDFRNRYRQPGSPRPKVGAESQALADQWRALAVYHGQLRDKRRREVWMPWVSLQPDPPHPSEPVTDAALRQHNEPRSRSNRGEPEL